ncbi:MAG: hypothetical protein KA419_11200 [Acidobacteria bacterium]|nr:hypothetical protein [Acidobacteriota bacterium]
MKRTMMLLVVLCLSLAVACSKSYGDVKAFLQKMTASMETFLSNIEKAQSASETATAMNKLCDDMESFTKEAEELKKKYPELGKETPSALKTEMDKLQEVSTRFQGPALRDKLMKFASDETVQSAAMRMVKVGNAMQMLGN